MGKILTGSNNESTFEILEAGSHAAICTQIIDIGLQESDYQGERKIQPKLKLRFEVPAERVTWKDKDGNEHEGAKVIWGTYTASLNEKAKLRAHLESWRGRAFTEDELNGFDIENVLGKPCLLTVVHKESNGRTYANIAGIGKLPKGMETPKSDSDIVYFDFDHHTQAQFDALPEWLQKLVVAGQETLQRQRDSLKQPPPEGPDEGDRFHDDDIPF